MTRDDLAAYQEDDARAALTALYNMCRRRFLRSLDLLELRDGRFRAVEVVGQSEPVDLWPLVLPWRVLCRRYRDEVFDPQTDLFVDVMTGAATAWSQFVHQKLFPSLVQDDETVRNVLRAVGALTCHRPDDARSALIHRFDQMTLPGQRPLWASEEEIY